MNDDLALVTDKRRIRVQRNPLHFIASKRDVQPWLVTCDFCPSDAGTPLPFPFALFHEGRRVLGWAGTWELAQWHANQHLAEHNAMRCPTCLCIPEVAVGVAWR